MEERGYINVLLLYENRADAIFTVEVFKSVPVATEIVALGNLLTALSLLMQKNGFYGASTPDLILIDSGLLYFAEDNILSNLKSEISSKAIRTFIFTESEDEGRFLNEKLPEFHYVVRPDDFDNFCLLIRSFLELLCTGLKEQAY